MHKILAVLLVFFNLHFASAQTETYQKNWIQIQSNIHYIDSICNKPYRSRMNVDLKRMKVKEKAAFPLKGKQKTTVFHRKGLVYTKKVYRVNREQKIKLMTQDGEIIMVKFKYKWRGNNTDKGTFFTKRKVMFIHTDGNQWLYTNKGKDRLINEKEKMKTVKKMVKQYIEMD